MVYFSSVFQGPALAIPEEVSACVLSFKHVCISHGFHKQEECFEADMHHGPATRTLICSTSWDQALHDWKLWLGMLSFYLVSLGSRSDPGLCVIWRKETFAVKAEICLKEWVILLHAAVSTTVLYFKCCFLPQGIFSHSLVFIMMKRLVLIWKEQCAR